MLEGGIDARLDGELDVVAINRRLPGVLGVRLRIAKHIHDIAVPQVQELVDHSRLEARDAHGFQDGPHHLRVARDVVFLRHRSSSSSRFIDCSQPSPPLRACGLLTKTLAHVLWVTVFNTGCPNIDFAF